MKVAMISYYLPSASKIGVGYQAHQLANALVDRGHAVTMFSACPPVEGARYHHTQVSPHGHLRTFRFALHLRRIDFSSYDVLHAHGDDYWMWRRRAQAHVRTLHGSCFEEAIHIRGLKERLRMFLLGLTEILATLVADKAVVISPGTRRWWPWVRTVIPCGTPLAPPVPGIERDPATVLMVGTWGNRKRGALLAREFVEHVLPRVPHAQLRMVASDVPATFHPSVTGLGKISDEALAREFQRATVFCLPSSYEGFGIPYVEAMASGTPVVATPNVGARYITDGGQYGLLATPRDLGPTIAGLILDPTRRAELSAVGLERARLFSIGRVAEQYEAVFNETIARRDRR